MGRQRLIGGVFGIESPAAGTFPPPSFLGRNSICLATARSGIWLLSEKIKPRQVWMPSYLCESMVAAVRRAGVKLRLYEVDEGLACTRLDWVEDVAPSDVVFFIDYFGFPARADALSAAKSRGACVVQDASQALLSEYGESPADFILYNPHKFVGVHDGGILVPRGGATLGRVALRAAPKDWSEKALRARIERAIYDQQGGGRAWFELFQSADREAPIGPYRMSARTRSVLEHGLDYESIARRRIDNYNALHEQLAHLALFPKPEPGAVPLGCPVLLNDRDAVRERLFSQEIYPPVHWPIPNVVPARFASSHELAKHIMTLPCDQRYDRADMRRMAEVLAAELPLRH